MAEHNKIVWSEGMFLRPQHFQQQEKYLSHLLQQSNEVNKPYLWGVHRVEVDEELLAIGKFGASALWGIFPDGTPFRCPEDAPLPAPVDLPTDLRNAVMFLALPVKRSGDRQIASASEDDNRARRYQLARRSVNDDESPNQTDAAELEFAELNISLRHEQQEMDDYTSLPLAKIVEVQSDNSVVLDPNFIPACVSADASPVLRGYLQELSGLLQQRGDALAGRLSSGNAGGVGEVIDFLFLQTINRNEPLIRHLCQAPRLHPLQVYRTFISLAGELATIAMQDHRPNEFPAYQHNQLADVFLPIMNDLRNSLNWVPDLRAVAIPLEKHKYGVQTAAVHDRSLLRDAQFVLAVNASIPEEDLRSNFPKQTTIATVESLRDLVMTHTPGVGLRPLSVAPRQIPFHTGFSYFQLDKESKTWAELETAGTLAIHFSGNYPSLELELWAIRTNESR